MDVEFGSEFTDPCVEIRRVGKLVHLTDKTELVPATARLSTDTLGRFKLEYVVSDQGEEQRFYRYVNMVDTTAPELVLIEPVNASGSWMAGFSEPEVRATDLVDGDLSDRVKTSYQEGKIVYSVSDSH